MTPSDFKIVPCELANISECVDIFDQAFANDGIGEYLYPDCDPKALREKALSNYQKSFTAPGVKYFKAIHKGTG